MMLVSRKKYDEVCTEVQLLRQELNTVHSLMVNDMEMNGQLIRQNDRLIKENLELKAQLDEAQQHLSYMTDVFTEEEKKLFAKVVHKLIQLKEQNEPNIHQ